MASKDNDNHKVKYIIGVDAGSNTCATVLTDFFTNAYIDSFESSFNDGYNAKQEDTPAAIRRNQKQARKAERQSKGRKFRLLFWFTKMYPNSVPWTFEDIKAAKAEDMIPPYVGAFLRKMDTMACRDLAAHEKVTPEVLLTALYSITTHRGSRIIRKNETPTKEDGVVAADIEYITAKMKEYSADTLGRLYHILNSNKALPYQERKFRGRHVDRMIHIVPEIDRIIEAQGFASDSAEYKALQEFRNDVIYQKPIQVQAHKIRRCPLEIDKRVINKDSPDYERYRFFCQVKSIKIITPTGEKKDLTQEMIDKIQPLFYVKTRKIKGDKLIKKLNPLIGEGCELNFDAEKTFETCRVSHNLMKAGIMKSYSPLDCTNDLDEIIRVLYRFDSIDRKEQWILKNYPETSEIGSRSKENGDKTKARILAELSIGNSYGEYSHKAIVNILKYLEKGFDLEEARMMGAMYKLFTSKEVFETEESHIAQIVRECRFQWKSDRDRDFVPGKFERIPGWNERVQKRMYAEYGIEKGDWDKKIYRKDGSLYNLPDGEKLDKLPELICRTSDPMAAKAARKIAKAVRTLLERNNIKPGEVILVIEMARCENSRRDRLILDRITKENEKARDEAVAKLEEHKSKHNLTFAITDELILKVLLAERQGWVDFSDGTEITVEKILAGAYDIDHIVAFSRSYDSAQENLQLVSKHFNRQVKRDLMMTETNEWNLYANECVEKLEKKVNSLRGKIEFLIEKKKEISGNDEDSNRKRDLKTAEIGALRDKVRRLKQVIKNYKATRANYKSERMDGGDSFLDRQIHQTSYAAKAIKEWGMTAFASVRMVTGRDTSMAREAWGVGEKDRTTYVHHIVDAYLVSLLYNRYRKKEMRDRFEWNGWRDVLKDRPRAPHRFFAQSLEMIETSVFDHSSDTRSPFRKNGKAVKDAVTGEWRRPHSDTVRGPLHKATLLRKTTNKKTGEVEFTKRVQLKGRIADVEATINSDKIRSDEELISQVRSEIERLKGTGATTVAFGDIVGKNGEPITRVWTFAGKKANAIRRIHDAPEDAKDENKYQYAMTESGNNFRLIVFYDKDGKPAAKEDSRIGRLLGGKYGNPELDMPAWENVKAVFKPNDSFWTVDKDGNKRECYTIKNFSQEHIIILPNMCSQKVSELKVSSSSRLVPGELNPKGTIPYGLFARMVCNGSIQKLCFGRK